MDMGQNKAPAKPMDPEQMDMCRKMCKCMGMKMDMSKDKPMNMSQCMKMGDGRPMDMSKDKGRSSGMDHDMNMEMGKDKSMNMGAGHETKMEMDPGMGRAIGKPAAAAGPLKIAFGDKSAEWTPATLGALPHATLTVFNAHAKANQTYTGVPLIELLSKLGVPAKPHGNDLRLYLVAEGADGYKAVYSVAEINPDLHDGTVIVADTMDGRPLAEAGPLQLVAAGEKRPARWVRNLVAVKVLAVE